VPIPIAQLGNLQIGTGILIAIGLALLIIIVAVVLVLRARRRRLMMERTRTPIAKSTPGTESFTEIVPQTSQVSTTMAPSEVTRTEVEAAPMLDVVGSSEEPKVFIAPRPPQNTTTILKGNVNIAAVTASPSQAAEIHTELTSLSYYEAITPNESFSDDQSLKTKISEVKEDLDSNENLSVILLKCIDIARGLNRRSDLKWIERELFGSPEWNDQIYVDISHEEAFPPYRLTYAAMYLNYTREGDEYPTVEEYAIPFFESRSVFALEKILEIANVQNQDYIVLNTPAPSQWPFTALLGELLTLTVPVRDYLHLLAEVKKQVSEFISSLELE
jgi:hypothetical protein